jgi:hypothetical protein
MIKRILLFGLFFLSINTYSQKDSTFRFGIYTSPLQAIDIFSRPMVTIGGEYIVFNKIGLSIEYGYKFKNVDSYDSLIVDSKGYSYRFEIKYYNINLIKSYHFRDYISLEYRYIKDDYNSQFEYATDSTHQTLVTDNYAIKKDIYVGNVKFGVIFNLNKVIYFDIYTGIGLRYRDVRNINRTFDENLGHEHKWPEYFWTISDFEEFSGLKVNFSFGFKLGIKI